MNYLKINTKEKKMKTLNKIIVALLLPLHIFASEGTTENKKTNKNPTSKKTSVQVINSKIHFQKPLIFKANGVGVMAKLLRKRLKKTKSAWVNQKSYTRVHFCDVTIKIEGRDYAVENEGIGEHLYGSVEYDCDSIIGRPAFKTVFNRTLFLGSRNCVQSETIRDQDHCYLGVIALRSESTINTEPNGDLIKRTLKKERKYQLERKNVRTLLSSGIFIPQGLNLNQMDSIDLFSFSIGTKSDEFYISDPPKTSNLVSGKKIYLQITDDSQKQIDTLKADATHLLDELNSKIMSLKSQEVSESQFEVEITELVNTLNTASEKILGIFNPSESFRLEQRLHQIEEDLAILAARVHTDITDYDSFVTSYGNQFNNLVVKQQYFNQGKSDSLVNTFLNTIYTGYLPPTPSKKEETTRKRTGFDENGQLTDPDELIGVDSMIFSTCILKFSYEFCVGMLEAGPGNKTYEEYRKEVE
ncbi:MAG: hypothetical protein CL678_06810 [Bdellovibrionaceae bacterium]|nr:hypothetical protein [Pseudobdellovibrionaceae bacterium]|tara:strand:- start:1337 stop:2749 length:1413 start_codon:yes stop_codon:yes gene_type:complete